jgi:hypothetical protein
MAVIAIFVTNLESKSVDCVKEPKSEHRKTFRADDAFLIICYFIFGDFSISSLVMSQYIYLYSTDYVAPLETMISIHSNIPKFYQRQILKSKCTFIEEMSEIYGLIVT